MRRLVFVVLAACGSHPAPTAATPPPIAAPGDAAVAALPPRTDFQVGSSPRGIVVAGNQLVWTDDAGAIFTMPAEPGVTPKQLSDQHTAGFMFHPVISGGDVFVSTKRDFVRVALPDGPVTKLGLALVEDPEEVIADDSFIYITMFKRDDVLAIPSRGGAPKKLGSIRRGVLAAHNGTVYAVSYANGSLVAFSPAGTKPIAKGFVRPTALAVDDTRAYVYSETEKNLKSVDLATGEQRVLAEGLENSDDLVADGAYLYTVSWPDKVMRIAKDGSHAPEAIASDLASPTRLAVTHDAIFVTSRDQAKIVRLAK